MNTFNLQNIIDKYNFSEELLAKELFPKNKFAKNALSRVLSGVSYLDTWQIGKLAEITGASISEMFDNTIWSKSISNDIIIFARNNYRAEFDLKTYITNIYISDKLASVETLISDRNIKLSEYLKLVDEVIIKLI